MSVETADVIRRAAMLIGFARAHVAEPSTCVAVLVVAERLLRRALAP